MLDATSLSGMDQEFFLNNLRSQVKLMVLVFGTIFLPWILNLGNDLQLVGYTIRMKMLKS